MKCTICGAATMPGSMLCRPCRAALKRARYVSVVDVPPSSLMQAHGARSRRDASKRAGAVNAGSKRPGSRSSLSSTSPNRHGWVRSLVAGVGAIVALGTIAWFGQARDPPASTVVAPAVVARSGTPPVPPAPTSAAATVLVATDRMPAPPTSSATAVDTAAAATRADPTVGAAAAAAIAGTRKSDLRPATVRAFPPTAPAAAPNATNAMLSTGPGMQGFGLDAPPLPPVVVPAPRVVPPPPPPRDRWQTMGDERARCDREGGIAGFICDQKVRLASCEGYWGRVPQCPLPPENPR